jgi:hypothetical protein
MRVERQLRQHMKSQGAVMEVETLNQCALVLFRFSYFSLHHHLFRRMSHIALCSFYWDS